MSENSFKSIRNAAIASVIAGIVLLFIPVLRGYVVNFLSWLWSGVVWCWESLVASYSLPGWAWLVISIFALKGLVNIYLAIKRESEQPEFKKYIEDHIHGAIWRWSWVGNQITNVWCYCPRCDATLVYNDSSCRNYLTDIKKTDFICENCGHRVVASIIGGDKDYATSAIMREIDRRIRTGEYKNH
ncbi:MAG: hypothetical protein U0998_06000 [Moraxellaceae bacterium]|nr:hypothetical protein [Moraxellaceae bacterium]MDZ4386759.1 hypothetical protein [Moraxellaceae bacterium]